MARVSFSHCREELGRKASKHPPKEAMGVSQVAAGRYNGLREGTILNSVEGGEEKTSVEVKPHCYLNSREIRLPRTPARREA